jgi:L-ascorbate metabolism protein UlaG (beta-lactamase superfamily)
MTQPVQRGADLLRDIESAECAAPTLWWLGHCGFVIKYGSTILYIDPYLSNSQEFRYRRVGGSHQRLTAAPLHPALIRHADLVLATHAHQSHLDPGTAPRILEASPACRLVLPKSAAGRAHMMGIDYARMTTIDAGQRVEFAGRDGEVIRIDAVPSAHESLDWTPERGYPYLGYVLRMGRWTLYHAGDCAPYDGLIERLRPFAIDLALLPISGRGAGSGKPGNFTVQEASGLAEAIGCTWLAPMHYGMFSASHTGADEFVNHVLGQRPGLRFKIFQCGERWTLPED